MIDPDSDDSFRANWEREARGLLEDLALIHLHRLLWSEVYKTLEPRAAKTDSTWLMHYTRLYLDSQSMAIRRLVQAKRSDPHRSINTLLQDLASRPDIIGSEVRSIRQDRDELNRVVTAVVSWANETLAHIHQQPTARMPSLDRLDEAIDKVANIFVDYAGRVTRTHFLISDPLPSPRWRSLLFQRVFIPPDWWQPPYGD